jgi:hypothetical protein
MIPALESKLLREITNRSGAIQDQVSPYFIYTNKCTLRGKINPFLMELSGLEMAQSNSEALVTVGGEFKFKSSRSGVIDNMGQRGAEGSQGPIAEVIAGPSKVILSVVLRPKSQT